MIPYWLNYRANLATAPSGSVVVIPDNEELAAIAARDGWTDVVAYVQRMVDDHCAAGDAMVASAGDATLLQKAKAAPKELRDQIDAVKLTAL